MKRPASHSLPAVEAEDWEEMDQTDAKDVWVATGELAKFLDAKAAFQGAGYRIRAAEIVKTHPIWVFFLTRETAPCVRDSDKFLRHIREIMGKAGVCFRDDDVMIQPTCNQIIISFLWPTSARGKRREEAWNKGRFESFLELQP